MKRIVIFIDGTRNDANAKEPTNVVRLAQCIRHYCDEGMPQVVLYSAGVGSGQGNTWIARQMDKVFGGALGWGLTAIIEEAYRRLIMIYEPGDEICVFGYSRGAFAARSLVGLIRTCGIIERDRIRFVPDAINKYRSMDDDAHPNADAMHEWRLKHAPMVTTNHKERAWRQREGHSVDGVVELKIAYLGVWDTVSALGAPEVLPIAKWLNKQYRFHDAELSSMVLAARHAISLDEARSTYPSYPWDNSQALNDLNVRAFERSHLQYWFAGNHGSVGGGGEHQGLSSIALNWIALGAARAGVGIDWSEMDKYAFHYDVTDPLINKTGPVGLAAFVLNHIKKRRSGPETLDVMSMAAIDRCLEMPDYRNHAPISAIRAEVDAINTGQRDRMRRAHARVDGGYTHVVGEVTRPREWLV